MILKRVEGAKILVSQEIYTPGRQETQNILNLKLLGVGEGGGANNHILGLTQADPRERQGPKIVNYNKLTECNILLYMKNMKKGDIFSPV